MRLGPLGKLRIAQVAPLSESVPPKLYGGTERVVAVLTDELVRQGHDVTLFASGDSRTSATLVAACAAGAAPGRAASIRSRPHADDRAGRAARATTSTSSTFTSRRCTFRWRAVWRRRIVTTMHGRLDLPDARAALRGVRRHPAGLDLRRAARRRCRTRTGSAPSITGFAERDSAVPSRGRDRISRFSAASRRRSVSIARSRSPRRVDGR